MNICATRLGRAVWFCCLLALLVLLPPAAFAQSAGSAVPSAEGGSRVMAVAAGWLHTCAVKADGSVACWGRNTEGQAPQTQDDANYGLLAGPYISIAAGEVHTCALKTDGDLVCWGKGAPHAGQTIAGPFVSVSAGGYQTAALRPDGSVAFWGDSPPQAVLAGPYVSVSAGRAHTCALKADGSVACWGYDRWGQTNPPIGPFVSISAGGDHTCGLKADGSLKCWGSNWVDEAPASPGQKNYEKLAGPFVSVWTGVDNTCALRTNGGAWCWGGSGLPGHAPATPEYTVGPFVSIAMGTYHTCMVRANGSVACWGAGTFDDLWLFNVRQGLPPHELDGTVGVLGFGQIAAGNAHACQVRPDGTLGCWGQNNYGDGALFGAATPPGGGTFTSVVTGDSHSCALNTDSKVTCWGRNGMENTALPLIANERFRQLAPGPDGAICALSINTSLDFCARRTVGYVHTNLQFRNITYTKDIAGSPELCGVSLTYFYIGYAYCSSGFIVGPWQRLESGLNHQCGLRDNGTIECWGDNTFGQANAPGGSFRAFSVGWNHACAIRGNGTLACWGNNVNGQSDAPSGAFVQVSAGNTFTCAIRDNGTRTCWGSDAQGQAPRLVLSPGTLSSGVTGSAYAGAQFGVADGTGSYVPTAPTSYALVAGALPPGLILSAAGVLNGTPTAVGTHTFSVEAKDGNGFTASREYSITVVDNTGPVINYTLTSVSPGNNGWYRGEVSIDWSVVDVDSAITSRTGCSPITLSSDTAGATFTCTATTAGGTSSSTTTTLKRDATAPTLTPSAPSPLLRGHSYSASPNASDATSGIANASCGLLDTGTLGTKSTPCSASDNAGNSNTVPLSYTVTTTCVNEGYSGTRLTWCRKICEMGYTGNTLNEWLRRWTEHYHDLPYCRLETH